MNEGVMGSHVACYITGFTIRQARWPAGTCLTTPRITTIRDELPGVPGQLETSALSHHTVGEGPICLDSSFLKYHNETSLQIIGPKFLTKK